MSSLDKVALFTNEYPPNVYGGAGVHVEYLSRELARLSRSRSAASATRTWTAPDLRVRGYGPWAGAKENTDPRFAGALDALQRSLAMAKDNLDADVVHCHTWYADMAGFLAKKLWGIPLVLTTHSLEPLRPWKVEQLGNAYGLSAWIERTGARGRRRGHRGLAGDPRATCCAHFAVDPDRVHVIHNGIDLDEYRPDRVRGRAGPARRRPERPYVLFVGRITRQKGIIHLVNAIPSIDPSLQVVLCAGAPDTREIGDEMTQRVAEVSRDRAGVIWIQQMIPRADAIQLYSHAAVFCCPSVYEPFGIINLEAMACETAVVASAVGGIPEVVVPGETGLLVDLEIRPGTFDPVDPAAFSRTLAEAINRVALDPALRERFGLAGRKRVEDHFSWAAIAAQTLDLYRSLVGS